jgi:hypothetical protein
MKSSVLCNIMQYSPMKVNRRFGRTHLGWWVNQEKNQHEAGNKKNLWLLLANCLVYSSVLKVDAVCSSKTLVNIYHTIWRHISEDCTLHRYRSEYLKPNNILTPAEFPEIADSTPLAGSLKLNHLSYTCSHTFPSSFHFAGHTDR